MVLDYREEMRRVFMLGGYHITERPAVSLACMRESHWECTMPGCKCPHHGTKPEPKRDPKPFFEEKAMTAAVGKQ